MQCYNCDSKKLVYDGSKDAYVCLDCRYEYPKQYFFLSHSHLDIEKVRIVRNIVEETFFYEPILFFLKCLSEEEEINSLIRREISERVWFIYCKSKNAEKSKFVAQERAYIDQLVRQGYNKKVLTVDLDRFEIWDDECLDDIRTQVSFKIRKTKIFLSSEPKDIAVAGPLYECLTTIGYNVWWDKNVAAKDFWQMSTSVSQRIKEHSYRDGIFMPVFTGETLSPFMQQEILRAYRNNALILPVVTDSKVFADLPPFLSARNGVVIDTGDLDHSLELLLETLDRL